MRTESPPDYRVSVSFDRTTQKHRAVSDDIPGLDLADMNLERLFAAVVREAPDLLKAAGKPGGKFNLKFEKVEGA